MFTIYKNPAYDPTPSRETELSRERERKKQQLRKTVAAQNRRNFPKHFTYDDLKPYWSKTVNSHDVPFLGLMQEDHKFCFHNQPIISILTEADQLSCESEHAVACREILDKFKLLIKNPPELPIERLFSLAVSQVENAHLEQEQRDAAPLWLRLVSGT